VRGRGDAGTGTIVGVLSRRAAAWVEGHFRIILGCVVIFGIGIGFGIAFAAAGTSGHPHPTTVVTVDRGTTVGLGDGASSP
jgi:hypothetical protein